MPVAAPQPKRTPSARKGSIPEGEPLFGFSLALLFIASAAVSIHWLGENSLTEGWWLNVIPPLWAAIIVVSLWEFYRYRARSLRAVRSLVLIIVLPAFRLSLTPMQPGWLWLPSLGWREHDRALEKELERLFSIPMLIIAALMIPILAIELFWHGQDMDPAVKLALNVATGSIWLSFAVEFVIRVSVAPSKLRYCATHWLDLLIILLPIISFLRSARLLRLGKLAKVARAYRMRGVATRALRALVAVDLIGRVLRRTPERQLAHLREKLELHREELGELEKQVAALERRIQEGHSDDH